MQRIVGALQAERLVTVSAAGSGIRLGPELHALAESARLPVTEMVRPLLLELSRRTEETVDLSVLRGQTLVFIDQIPGTQRLRAVSSVGEAFPLTTTANGKACLALMDDADVAHRAVAEWASTGNARDIAAFMAEIATIRTSGVADRPGRAHAGHFGRRHRLPRLEGRDTCGLRADTLGPLQERQGDAGTRHRKASPGYRQHRFRLASSGGSTVRGWIC